jgi:hypothetical protein
MSKEKHFVAYLKWDVREYWKEITPHGNTGKRPYPYKFGSNQRHFPTSVTKGSMLWIVSSPNFDEGGYWLPPTLIARLYVKDVRRGKSSKHKSLPEDYDWVAVADPRDKLSRYFPVNNAFHTLTEIEFENYRGKRRKVPKRLRHPNTKNPYLHIPRFLRNVSRVAPEKVMPLQDLARQIETGRTVFVSYSHHDQSSFVRKFIKCLRHEDFAPWIDLESIPQMKRDEKEIFGDTLLSKILEDGIRQARLMIAFIGSEYEKRYWTNEEWEFGLKAFENREDFSLVQVLLDGNELSRQVHSINASTPDQTAREVRRWWDQQASAQ